MRKLVWEFLVTQDALGLKIRKFSGFFTLAQPREFEFLTDAGKLTAFNLWFTSQATAGILFPDPGTDLTRPWTTEYVESAYRRGLLNAYLAAPRDVNAAWPDVTTQSAFLRAAFGSPEARSKVQLLATRSLESLKGVTAAMASEMNRILAQGMIDGVGPARIARQMTDRIDGLTRQRALTIARTEIINAHAEGQLDAFERLGVERLGVLAEWSTAGDERVCLLCAPLEGKTFTVAEARGKIPVHPNCVLGSSIIKSHDCLALTRAKYFGKILRIRTQTGRLLSVTQNHILPTRRGWIRAIELVQGDELLDAASLDSRFQTPDNQNNQITIEEIFNLALKSFPENLRPITRTASEDFHGDGCFIEEKIDVIFSDCFLGDQFQSSVFAQSKKFSFMDGNISTVHSQLFPSLSAASFFLHRHFSSPYSKVGSSRVPLVFLGCSKGHHQSIGISDPTNVHITMDKSMPDYVSGATECFGDMIDALPTVVAFDKIVQIQIEEAGGTGVFVFDVWTHCSSYILEGVLSSNCRCSWKPFIPRSLTR